MTQPPGWGAPPPQQPQGGWPVQPGSGPGGPWGPPPPPWPAPVPPKKSGVGKWVVGAVALVAVIAATVVVTLTWTKNSDAGNTGSTNAAAPPSGVASANDKGPVGIITEDPSCAPWSPIIDTLADVGGHGWLTRDPSIPASSWTPETQAQHETVAAAMRKAADQAVPLAKMTTHRVMRELYEQFIAYSRAYADSVPRYVPLDDNLARAGSTAGNAITDICSAITFGSAAARATLLPGVMSPTSIPPIGDLSNPQRVFSAPDTVCADLIATIEQFANSPAYKSWLNTDPAIAVGNWSPEQQTLTAAMTPLMAANADALEKLARRSSNPTVQDLLLFGVQYQRTYIQALATYRSSDQYINGAGQRSAAVLRAACNYAAR